MFLVTGGTGQVGYELTRELAPLGNVLAPTRAELDLARPKSIKEFVRRVRPNIIVNAGAYTAVDKAESEREACFAVNATAPGVLAEEALRLGAALIHYSTDYVFDGSKAEPYVETDEPRPINVYGESKLLGERAVAQVGGAWIVLRTSWVYGMRGRNFLLTILRVARKEDELRVVNDQTGAPTWSRSIATATCRIIAAAHARANRIGESRGIYNITAEGRTNWCDFARAILAADPRPGEQRCRRVVGIPSEAFPTAARRPKWSVLSNDKLRRHFGLQIGGWREDLGHAFSASE